MARRGNRRLFIKHPTQVWLGTIGDIFINVDVARDSFPLTSNMLFPVTVGGRDGVECASMQHLGY